MIDAALLAEVKYQAGIFYNDAQINSSVKSMIESCRQYLLTAGVNVTALDSPLALDVYVMWVDAKRSGSFLSLPHSPAFVGLVVQLKNGEAVVK